MTIKYLSIASVIAATLYTTPCQAAQPFSSPVTWETWPDTWVAVDELGREVATTDSGIQRSEIDSNATIGMFYYIWHGEHTESGLDITKLLNENPYTPKWGNEFEMHWGSEPWLGYYRAGNPFIVAKHIQMLVDAGVDFLFFDCTNAFVYPHNVQVVISELERRRTLGMKYPRLAFMLHSHPDNTIQEVYNHFYRNKPELNKYWYFHDGKPLILAPIEEIPDIAAEIRNHFTFRNSWAWRQNMLNLPAEWSWLENYPQKPGWMPDNGYESDTTKKTIEQMSVSVAQHPTTKIGKSFHRFHQPETNPYGLCKETPQGLYFQEQWDQAIKVHPPVVMVTQFNEWIAQRFIIKDSTELSQCRPGVPMRIGETFFVDVYSAEFSRDLEPSKHPAVRDNYYLQMASNARRYRGANTIPVPTTNLKIKIKGNFNQWDSETVEYRDDKDDTFFTSEDIQSAETLSRPTNDIIRAKVTKDKKNIYFFVETANDMGTPENTPRWMHLLINADCNYTNGWNGYDFIVHLDINSGKYSLMRNRTTGKYEWETICAVEYRVEGNRMHLAIPRKLIGHNKADKDLDFKWADNIPHNVTDILNFISDGDVAPNARFNYRYKGSLRPTL